MGLPQSRPPGKASRHIPARRKDKDKVVRGPLAAGFGLAIRGGLSFPARAPLYRRARLASGYYSPRNCPSRSARTGLYRARAVSSPPETNQNRRALVLTG